jgi:hypothetical protein
MTKMYFYEAAAYVLCAVTSGAPSVQTPLPAKAVVADAITPMEAKFGVEMAVAASRLSREEASGIVVRLLQDYESQIEAPPPVTLYHECYDVVTGKPSGEYLHLYDEVKEELARMGVPFE